MIRSHFIARSMTESAPSVQPALSCHQPSSCSLCEIEILTKNLLDCNVCHRQHLCWYCFLTCCLDTNGREQRYQQHQSNRAENVSIPHATAHAQARVPRPDISPIQYSATCRCADCLDRQQPRKRKENMSDSYVMELHKHHAFKRFRLSSRSSNSLS